MLAYGSFPYFYYYYYYYYLFIYLFGNIEFKDLIIFYLGYSINELGVFLNERNFGWKVTTLMEILKTRLKEKENFWIKDQKCYNHLKSLKILLALFELNFELVKLMMCTLSNLHCIAPFCVWTKTVTFT